MNQDIYDIVKLNTDFVKNHTLMNLNFVYLQIDNITKLIGNEEFMTELKIFINHVLDRDDNGIFDSEDIRLLRDIFINKRNQVLNIYAFVMEVFNGILTLVGKIDKSLLKLDKSAIEGLFFGVTSYVLFQYGKKDTETKLMTVDIMIAVYSTLRTVDNTLKVSQSVLNLFKRKGWCKCLYTNNTDAADKEIIRSALRVKDISADMKNTEILYREVEKLSSKTCTISDV